METKIAVLITAALACATWQSADAVRGIILTCPRFLDQNAVNKLYLSLYDVNAPGSMTITLLTDEKSKVLAQTSVDIKAGEIEKVIHITVPETSEYGATITSNATFDTDDNYTFFDEEDVVFRTVTKSITFIQTDKPIYKPGQKVMFRILPVDKNLRPLGENTTGDAWVEDAAGSRVAQWKNITFDYGIRHFEVPLSEEPVLGTWKISVLINHVTQENTNFEVKEYVLPKFEVTITSPPYVLANSEIIPIEICAKYTYGKLVDGIIAINSSVEPYSWSHEKYPTAEVEDKIEGCYTYQLNVSLVDIDYMYVYRRLKIYVEVTESGTGITRNNTGYVERTQNPLKMEFGENIEYFKPGLPSSGKVIILNPDDSAAANEDVQICATITRERILQRWWATRKVKLCQNYTSDSDGRIPFSLPPQRDDTVSISLEAKSMKYSEPSKVPGSPTLYQAQISSYFQPWFSPSRSHLQIQGSKENLKCGERQTMKILYNAKDGQKYRFYYEVMSKGQMVFKASKEVTFTAADDITKSVCNSPIAVDTVEIPIMPPVSAEDVDDVVAERGPCENQEDGSYIGVEELPLDVSPMLSPGFKFLVYYIREDGETVADSSEFKVEKCFKNQVDFQFGNLEVQPGDKTTLTVKASPNSVCGIKVVDKSVSLLDSNDQLTKERVFKVLKDLDSDRFYPRNPCNNPRLRDRADTRSKGFRPPTIIPRPWSSSRYADSITAFESVGVVVMSDLTLFTRPCKKNSNSYENYGGIAMASYGVRGGSAGGAIQPAMAFSSDARRKPMNEVASSKLASSATKSVVEVRNFFPETWLFQNVAVGENGETIMKQTLPHTITEWRGSAVCINPVDGLGLSDVSSIRGFQAFFLSFTLPYSVIRGEKVPVVVTIFNYLDDCLPITLTLEDSEWTGGFVLKSESSEKDYCVCGGKSVTHKFSIIPSMVGFVNITVSGRTAKTPAVCADETVASVVARDSATVQLLVEAEGFPQEKVNSILFCPQQNENSLFKETLQLHHPEDIVPDSKRTYITVTGDVMGPAIEGLENLVQLPTGCGEQNMVRFVPNIVVLKYLTSVRKLTEILKQKALKNMNTGYQRELKYRHPDGSYSAFGTRDKSGSTWLTAFVLKSFSQAKEYITIDEEDTNKTTDWLVSQQGLDGCFQEVGRVLQEGMKGGVSSSKNPTSTLTAYVLIALITANYRDERVIKSSFACLEREENLSPYKASLFAYAAALANDSKADTYIEQLLEMAEVSGGEMWWRNVNGSSSVDIETASYTLLALLKRKGDASLTQDLSIVRKLTKMRNSNGGFSSTQDTVIGLEAMSAYATVASRDPVSLTAKYNDGVEERTVVVTEDDKILVKKSKISELATAVDFEATGTGCGLVQVSLRYNTVTEQKKAFFSIEVNSERMENCKIANLSICVSYLPQDQKSNMALVEVKMLSGYEVLKESLEKLINDAKVRLKRFDIENNNVVFYFDELTNRRKCFSFEIGDVMAIEEVKPATVKVYDYYSKEKEERTQYTLRDTCPEE